jgi:hypothetical protein
MSILPDPRKYRNKKDTGDGPGEPEPHDDPAPYDGVEDEDEDVRDDRRREPASDDGCEPDDDDEGVWSSGD